MAALTFHDLTNLPDILTVGIGAGLVLGGSVGFFWRAASNAELAQNIALGSALGSIAGALFGFVLWLTVTAAGA